MFLLLFELFCKAIITTAVKLSFYPGKLRIEKNWNKTEMTKTALILQKQS